MKENNNRRPAANRNARPNNNNNNRNRTPQNILPPSRVLESYEEIAPGSVAKLMELTKREQDHRHSWQDKYLKLYNFNYKAGLLFGFIYNIALLAVIYDLINQHKESLALKLFVVNAALIAFAIIVTVVERKVTTRKPPRRINSNQNHNPNHNKDRQAPRSNSKPITK
ncbi:MAG: DUF2335 domain-containing protein [Pseudomonadota bacterium]